MASGGPGSNPFQRFARRTSQGPPDQVPIPSTSQQVSSPSNKRSRLLESTSPATSRHSPRLQQSSASIATQQLMPAKASPAPSQTAMEASNAANSDEEDIREQLIESPDVNSAPSVSNPRAGAVGMREKLGEPVQPLRMIIIGHNPSETTWRLGHAYAHPSNHMWRLLIRTGIAPPEIKGADDDDRMPPLAGVGFSDVGTGHPGTQSHLFKSAVFVRWSENFYDRMRSHVAKANAAIGCTCGTCGAPVLVAFAGKRQYMELLNLGRRGSAKIKTVPFGWQDPQSPRPDGWPFPDSTEIWVCSSTSGAAVLTNEQREAPYRAVAERLATVPWPRTDIPRCHATNGDMLLPS